MCPRRDVPRVSDIMADQYKLTALHLAVALNGFKTSSYRIFFTDDCVFVCRHILYGVISIFSLVSSFLLIRSHFFLFYFVFFLLFCNCPSLNIFSYIAVRSRRGRGSEMRRHYAMQSICSRSPLFSS